MVLLKEALDFCKRATHLEPGYAFAWYCLGSTYLLRFFLTSQLDTRDLVSNINIQFKRVKLKKHCFFPNFLRFRL